MPRVAAALLAVLLCQSALCSADAQDAKDLSSPGSFMLARGRAGPFRLDMPVEQVYDLVGRDRIRLAASFRGAEFLPALEIQLAGFTAGPALTAAIREWPCGFALWTIWVHDPRYRTANGLGVGSTLGDVKRFYRDAKVTGIDTDDGAHVAISELGLWFEMNPATSFPDSTRIASARVMPQPRDARDRCTEQRLSPR